MRTRSTLSALAAILVAACAAGLSAPDATLDDLFAAERAFARDSTEHGIRAAFLDHFASDGLDFRPGPGIMRERMRARPAPADPLALALERGARSLDPDPEEASYFELLSNSARIFREGSYAIVGADAARKALAATGRRVIWTPAGGAASASDDLGYTYGRFVRFIGSS